MSNTPKPSPAMFAGRRPSGPAYRVFTVAPAYGGGLVVTDGAKVEAVAIKAANTSISAVIIGEEGRGRERAVLPCPAVPEGERLMAASVGTSQSGKPRLNAAQGAPSPDETIIVFRTPMGVRGGNAHTGEPVGWKCPCGASGSDATPDTCPQCAASRTGYSGPRREFAPFPGEIIARGRIAEGDAGRMGSGEQLVAVVKKNAVFRIRIFSDGRRRPSVYYGNWDGEHVVLMTAEERELLMDAQAEGTTAHVVDPGGDDGLELLREQLGAWLTAMGREHRNVRNTPEARRVRDLVGAALRGGRETELKAAHRAATSVRGTSLASFKLSQTSFRETPVATSQVAAQIPEESLADWERELYAEAGLV